MGDILLLLWERGITITRHGQGKQGQSGGPGVKSALFDITAKIHHSPFFPATSYPHCLWRAPSKKRAGAASGGRGNRPDRGNSHFVLTFFGFFLIYGYCVSVTNIAGVCKSILRELGGRLGLEKPQKGEGGGFARAGG